MGVVRHPYFATRVDCACDVGLVGLDDEARCTGRTHERQMLTTMVGPRVADRDGRGHRR